MGVAGWPVTGRRGGVLNITAAAWTAGFHWWRPGNITRTQNVSKYMLVLALCLVKTEVKIKLWFYFWFKTEAKLDIGLKPDFKVFVNQN